MKKLFSILFILSCGCTLFMVAIWHLTDGFTLAKIKSDFPFSSEWEVANPPEKEAQSLLSQHFYYLGKGSQCYVFESEDKQIVLKFFRHSRYRLPKLNQLIAFPSFLVAIQNQKKEIKQKKLDALFRSCKLAFEDLHDETGLLYLHLNPTTTLTKTVVLYDKLKRAYPINIDDYTFIIQKQGMQIFPYFTRLLQKGKNREAKEALADLTALIANRLKKGIADHDAVIHKNSGFQGDRAFFIDIGEFSKEPISDIQQELREATYQLRLWLNEKDPQLANYLESLLVEIGIPKRS